MLQLVMDDRFAGGFVDRLPLRQLHLLANLVECEPGAQPLGLREVDRDVMRLDKAIDHSARAVFGRASGKHEGREQERSGVKASATGLIESSARRHFFFLKSSSSFACADLPSCAPAPPLPWPGLKYSQKFARSLSTTRSAIGSRHWLL